MSCGLDRQSPSQLHSVISISLCIVQYPLEVWVADLCLNIYIIAFGYIVNVGLDISYSGQSQQIFGRAEWF